MSLIIEAAKNVQIVPHETQLGDRVDKQMAIVEYPSGRIERRDLGYPENVQGGINKRRWANRLLYPTVALGVISGSEGIIRMIIGLNDPPTFLMGGLELAGELVLGTIILTLAQDNSKTFALMQQAWNERLKEVIKFSQRPAILQ